MPASNHVQRTTLALWLKGQEAAPPMGLYLALYTTNPSAADNGTEVNGGGYVRMPVQFGTISIQGNGSTVSNSSKVEYLEATTSWGKVAYFGIRDAETGGNLLYYSPLATAFDVQSGTAPKFDVGTITVTLE